MLKIRTLSIPLENVGGNVIKVNLRISETVLALHSFYNNEIVVVIAEDVGKDYPSIENEHEFWFLDGGGMCPVGVSFLGQYRGRLLFHRCAGC